MDEIITILEAEVAEDKWQLLKQTFENETTQVPEGILETSLLQSQSQLERWRIVTHWRSQNDLDQMRATVEVPVGVRIFQAVGATPQLELWHAETHLLGPSLRK